MLRSCILLLFASGLLVSSFAQTPPTKLSLPDQVKAQRWQKRVVILYAPTAESAELQQQKASIAAAETQVKDRDILVIEAIEADLSTSEKQYVRQTLGLTAGRFAVVLLGKDGGVKRKETKPINPKSLFETIDTMPMRRQELRDKGK
jgi:hypothetical protein